MMSIEDEEEGNNTELVCVISFFFIYLQSLSKTSACQTVLLHDMVITVK